MTKIEGFSSKWGVILAALGMAVGAGNIWRFPRLAGQYGGAFILLWVVFLFIWAIPLLMTEFSLGKKRQAGVVGSFAGFAGKNYTWMGFFVTVCTLGIAFYYAVITGWSLRYLGFSIQNLVDQYDGGSTFGDKIVEDPQLLSNFWQTTAYGSCLRSLW
jgi:neurotransmitter:Na+ symporter, NSS family